MGRKSRFVRGTLLGGEGEDSGASLAELVTHCNLVSGERVLGKVTRVADATGTKSVTTFLEIGVRMRTDLSTVVVDHVNGFVTCHVVRAILVSASKLHFEGSYSDALTLRSARTLFAYVPRESPLSSMRGVKGLV